MTQNTYAYHPVPSGDNQVDNVPLLDPARDPPRDKANGQTANRILLGVLFVVLLSLCLLYVRETTLNQASCFRGLHRNGMSYAHEKLPNHYTLRSGDKIPSVGLGKYYRMQTSTDRT